MRLTKQQAKLYKSEFDAEMAAMSLQECVRWNPHVNLDEAQQMIARAQKRVSGRSGKSTSQQALLF